LPGIGFGLAATTLVGQALGRKDAADAHRWAWDVYRVAAKLFIAIAIPMLVIPGPILEFFLRDPQLAQTGRFALQLVGFNVLIDGLGLVMMHALLGAGASGLVMKVSVGTQWLLSLPLAYLVGPALQLGLTAIWISVAISRGLQAWVFTTAWQRRTWVHI